MAQEFSDLPAEKRRQITNAAIQVFAEKGYRQANTRDIAAKAGISKGLLFYYFKNKKSLYLKIKRRKKTNLQSTALLEKFM